MQRSPTTHHTRPRPTSRRHARAALGLVVILATMSLACSDDTTNLSSLAEQTFSTDAVWRGDDRYVTVTITESNFLSIIELAVYLEELGFSPAVYERMNRTRALDGTQSSTSDLANVTWTYHPDNGLQAVFEREDGR